MKNMGVADFDDAMMKPNEALLKFYEDAAGHERASLLSCERDRE